jgi:hypothetical protein
MMVTKYFSSSAKVNDHLSYTSTYAYMVCTGTDVMSPRPTGTVVAILHCILHIYSTNIRTEYFKHAA